jgi:hypothetical protein
MAGLEKRPAGNTNGAAGPGVYWPQEMIRRAAEALHECGSNDSIILARTALTAAKRCGHDPAVLLRVYAKLSRKADTSAAAEISALSKGVLGGEQIGPKLAPRAERLPRRSSPSYTKPLILLVWKGGRVV